MKNLDKYIEAVKRFINENNREPTAIDFDITPYLPTARTIQRRFGGLQSFRKHMNLETIDFTKGSMRAAKAKASMNDCLIDETVLFVDLLKKYTQEKVSSPARVFLNSGITADFCLKYKNTTYLIDVFKPNTTQSFKGCINIKNKKYLKQNEESFYLDPVKFLYVCANENVMVPTNNPIPIISLSSFRKKFLD